MAQMDKSQIKALALLIGFKLKPQSDGEMDLNPYVYEFAEALLNSRTEKADGAELVIVALDDQLDQLSAQNATLRAELERFRPFSAGGSFEYTESSESMGDDVIAALDATPAVCVATVKSQGAEEFKNELVKSVRAMLRPHIEGVCAVVKQRIHQQAQESAQ